MKVILLKDVRKVGRKYEIKDVSEGYAMNSLIPNGLAAIATGGALKRAEELRAKEDEARRLRDEKLASAIDALKDTTVRMSGKANEQGHLFASIQKEKLMEELRKQSGLDIESEHVELEKPIKEVGEHKIEVEVAGRKATFTVIVEQA